MQISNQMKWYTKQFTKINMKSSDQRIAAEIRIVYTHSSNYKTCACTHGSTFRIDIPVSKWFTVVNFLKSSVMFRSFHRQCTQRNFWYQVSQTAVILSWPLRQCLLLWQNCSLLMSQHGIFHEVKASQLTVSSISTIVSDAVLVCVHTLPLSSARWEVVNEQFLVEEITWENMAQAKSMIECTVIPWIPVILAATMALWCIAKNYCPIILCQ